MELVESQVIKVNHRKIAAGCALLVILIALCDMVLANVLHYGWAALLRTEGVGNYIFSSTLAAMGVLLWLTLRVEEWRRRQRLFLGALALCVGLFAFVMVWVASPWSDAASPSKLSLWLSQEEYPPFLGMIGLAMVGMAIFQLSLRFRHYRESALCWSTAAFLVGAGAALGNVLEIEVLRQSHGFDVTSALDATALMILAVGMMFAGPPEKLINLLTSDSAGSSVMRRVLPVAVLLPLLVSWLRIKGEEIGLYGLETGVTLATVGYSAGLFYVIWKNAATLHKTHLQQKEMILSLRETEARYRATFENAKEGIFQISREGKLLNCNPALVTIFGYESVKELLSYEGDAWQLLHLDPLAGDDFMDEIQERGEVSQRETKAQRKNHRMIWISESGHAHRDAAGKILYYEGSVVDITLRKLAEEALVRSENRFHTFMDNNPAVVFMKDAQGRYLYVNKTFERVFRLSRQNIIGKSDYDWLPADAVEETQRNDEQVLRTGKLVEAIERVPTEGGADRWWFSFKFPMDDPTGGRVIAGVSLDITERQEAELAMARARDMALQSTRMKSEFLANMSHEIRTPMNGLIGMADLLLDTPLNLKQVEFAQTIRSSADALLEIINDILDFSKIEAGMLRFEHYDFDLGPVLEDSVALLAQKAESKNLELICSLDPRLPRLVRGDAGRLRQILVNLIGNAVKFTEKGEVVLEADLEKMEGNIAYLRITVRDTGIGLSSEQIERLFKPFSQADGSTTRRYGGTGLGLAICKQLVGCMNGEIHVDAELGVGSAFHFTAQLEVAEPLSMVSIEPDLADAKVLVIDDNPTSRATLRNSIMAMGAECLSIGNASEAMGILLNAVENDRSFDILLLEANNQESNAILNRIKSEKRLSSLKKILLTSWDVVLEDSDLISRNLHAAIAKPVRLSLLRDTLLRIQTSGDHVTIPAVLPKKIAPVSVRSTSKPIKVLLADDNLVNRKVATYQLEKLGIIPLIAVNGREAVEAVTQEFDIDVILMDCQMPECDGYEATQIIRQIQTKPSYIIALTAHSLAGDRDKCLAAGMDDYLSKPVELSELRAALSRSPAWDASAVSSLATSTTPSILQVPLPHNDEPVIDPKKRNTDLDDEVFFRLVADLFITHTRELLLEAHEAHDRNDPDTLSRIAHTIKGSCSNFGATRLQRVSHTLEQSTLESITPQTLAQLEAVELEFHSLEKVLLQIVPEAVVT